MLSQATAPEENASSATARGLSGSELTARESYKRGGCRDMSRRFPPRYPCVHGARHRGVPSRMSFDETGQRVAQTRLVGSLPGYRSSASRLERRFVNMTSATTNKSDLAGAGWRSDGW